MIIRRISEGIKKQDWFVVAVEVMIVVAGIFIALQVDRWSQSRQDGIDEEAFLLRAQAELVEAVSSRKSDIEKRPMLYEAMQTAIDLIFVSKEIREFTDMECRAIYSSNVRTNFISGLPSLNALITTGRINIISNSSLQSAFLSFEQHRENLDKQLARITGDGHELASEFSEMFAISPFRDENNDLRANPKCNLEAMRANNEFKISFMKNADRYDGYINSLFLPLLDSVETLQMLLDEEIKTRNIN